MDVSRRTCFSLLAEEALYSRRVFAVARCGWCSGITRMRLLRVSPPALGKMLMPREGGGCCCCWDSDCREGEDGADGTRAVERKRRERDLGRSFQRVAPPRHGEAGNSHAPVRRGCVMLPSGGGEGLSRERHVWSIIDMQLRFVFWWVFLLHSAWYSYCYLKRVIY